MCVTSKYLNQIETMLGEIKGDIEKLRLKQSEYDKKLTDHYHKVEIGKFNACEGYYLTKQLQEILQKRRLIKSELYRMDQMHKQLVKSMIDRIPVLKRTVENSKNRGKAWLDNFDISFSDIEDEVLQ
jgi:hypothetical protein